MCRRAGHDRRVHHIADEQVHHRLARPLGAEQLLSTRQRPRVAVHPHRQSGMRGQCVAHGNVLPAKGSVRHDSAGVRVHPAADRHAEAERHPVRLMLRTERDQLAGRAGEHAVRIGGLVRQSALRANPAA